MPTCTESDCLASPQHALVQPQACLAATQSSRSTAAFQDLPIHLQSYILASGAAPLNTCKAAAAIASDLQLVITWLTHRHCNSSDTGILEVACTHRHWPACIWALENRHSRQATLNQALLHATKAGQLSVVQKLMEHGAWAGWIWENPPLARYLHQAETGDLPARQRPPQGMYTHEEWRLLFTQPTPLEEAARLGHVELLRWFLQQEHAIHVAFQAFCLATAEGQLAAMQLLLDSYPDMVQRRQVMQVALCLAAEGGHVAAVQLLTDKMPGLSQSDLANSPLAAASRNGQLGMMRFFLEQGADPQGRPGHPWSSTSARACSSPVWSAACSGSCEAVQLLLDAGVPAQAFADSGALSAAAIHGSTPAVQLLLDTLAAGSCLEPLQLHQAVRAAAMASQPSVIRLLLNYAPRPHELLQPVGDRGDHSSALCSAAYRGSVETVQAILEHCRDATSIDGNRALLKAASKNCVPIMQLLVDHGVHVHGCPFTTDAPLSHAIEHRAAEAVQWLLQQGAQADGRALMHAVQRRSLACVQLLLQHGVQDSEDRALYAAAQLGSLDTVQLLLSPPADMSAGCRVEGSKAAVQIEAALCGAASTGQLPVVRWLVTTGTCEAAAAAAAAAPAVLQENSCFQYSPAVLHRALEAVIMGTSYTYQHPLWGRQPQGLPDSLINLLDHMSNEQDRHDVANLLLQSGADLGVGDGRLVLLAIQHGKYTLLQEACEAAPGPVIVSGAALQAAQAADDRQAFISLLPLTDLSQMDVDAALVFAAKHVCIQEVERLLNWGADADTNSGAPLSLAIQQQSATLAALLLQHGAQPSGSQVQGLLAFAGPDLLNVLEASNIMPRTVARLAS